MPFIQYVETDKNSGINLIKKTNELYNENYKILMKEIKETTTITTKIN